MNLAGLLLDHPFSDDEDLLHTVDRTITAGEARAAARLVAAELGPLDGTAVAVQLPNGPDLVATMVGVWLAGGVYIPVNPRLPALELADVLSATSPAAFVTEAGIERRSGGQPYPPDVAFVMWTSGTTGRPKAVHHTHTAYVELLDRVLGPLRGAGTESRKPSPNLIPVSMALNAGLYNALFGLRAGAPLVIMDQFDPEAFASLVRRFEIRSTVLPPAAMAMLTDSTITDLAPLKYVRSITAPLSPLQAKRFAAKFPVFVLNGCLLGDLPGRRGRLREPARCTGEAAAQRLRLYLRARELDCARLRLPLRLSGPAPHGDCPGTARARVQPELDHHRALGGLPGLPALR